MITAKSDTQTRSITILCSGNWLVTHDRIGPRVYEALDGSYDNRVSVVNTGSCGLALLDHIAGQDLMLIIDACVYGDYPGQIHIQETDFTDSCTGMTSIHQAGPVETLCIARRLYPEKVPARTLFILVNTEGLDEPGEKKACDDVVAIIDKEVGKVL